MESVQSRHELLRNLGVGQWYSKYTLSNSPATPINLLSAALPGHDEVVGSDADLYVSSVGDAQAGKRSLDVVMTELVVPSTETQPKPILEIPNKVLSVVSLSLVMVKVEGLLVCYESSGEFQSEQSLLLAIVRSIYPDVVSFEEVDSSSFVWPPFLSSRLFNDQSVYFEPNLKRWFSSYDLGNVSQVIYFGLAFELVEKVILELRAEVEADFIMHPLALGLSELLATPVKKKNLWSLLSRVGVLGG